MKYQRYINPHFRNLWLFGILSLLATIMSSCNTDLSTTSLEIEDPERLYYPIVQGEKQTIVIKITNTGQKALVINHVLPSCGCILAKYPKSAIRVGEIGFIELEYNSNKNIGYVELYTTIIANTEPVSHTFVFKTNVVPNALYTPDYEELYKAEKEDEKGAIQQMVDGKANQKGYIVDTTETRKHK